MLEDGQGARTNSSVGQILHRQVMGESSTDANSLLENCAMSSDLTELGQEAIAAVSRDVADGAPLVKCQLLASA
jgi:hypothetical protein